MARAQQRARPWKATRHAAAISAPTRGAHGGHVERDLTGTRQHATPPRPSRGYTTRASTQRLEEGIQVGTDRTSMRMPGDERDRAEACEAWLHGRRGGHIIPPPTPDPPHKGERGAHGRGKQGTPMWGADGHAPYALPRAPSGTRGTRCVGSAPHSPPRARRDHMETKAPGRARDSPLPHDQGYRGTGARAPSHVAPLARNRTLTEGGRRTSHEGGRAVATPLATPPGTPPGPVTGAMGRSVALAW